MDSRASFGVIVAVFQYGWGVGLVNTAVVGADDGPQAIAALRPAYAPSHDANPKAPAAHAALARNDRRAPVWVTFGLLVFLGLSGMFVGLGLIFGIWGIQRIPREPLDPFR